MLIEDDRVPLRGLQEKLRPEQPVEEEDGYTFLEKLHTGFLLENTIGSMINNDVIDAPSDPNYNPFEHITDDEKLDEVFLDNAVHARSEIELDSIRKQVAKEREQKANMTGAGGMTAYLLGALTDPINFVPIGGMLTKAYKAGNVLKGGLQTAGVTAGVVGATEAVLQQNQLTRSGGESAINITASAVLGGVLGSSISLLNRSQMNRAVKDIEETFSDDLVGSVGAMEANTYKIKGPLLEKLLRKTAYDPLTRSLTQPSQAGRKLVTELIESPLEIDGISEIAAETSAKQANDMYVYRFMQGRDEAYKNYLKEEATSRIGAKFKKDIFSRTKFNELISKEIRNPNPNTNIHVKNAARHVEDTIFNPVKKDLIDNRLLKPDVKVTTAAGYVNRVWSREQIMADLPRFTDKVEDWLVSVGVSRENIGEGPPARLVASQIANNIISSHNSMLPMDYVLPVGVKGPLKSRVFDIPDELIEDFLENDIEVLVTRYLKQTLPDLEIVRKFGSPDKSINKTLNFEDELLEIEEDYNALIAEAKSPKEALKLDKQKKRTIDDIQAMRDRMRGTYGVPQDINSGFARFNQTAKNLNFLRLMGGVTISSFPDYARLIMADGMMRAFGGSFRHLSRALAGMDNLAAEELRYWGIGTDAFVNGRGGRLQAISDIGEYVTGNTKIESGLELASNKMGQINLMNRWTGAMKQIHAVGMQTKVMDTLLKGKYDHRLFRLGISETDAKKIRDSVLKHGKKDGTAWVYNAKEWDDSALALKWYQALKKESDRVIVVPGQEKPLFMSREMGKMVMQFKSFMMSATQRVTIAGIQRQDAHFIQGGIFLVAMGAMTYVFKNKEAGREVDMSPMALVVEGIDRSGALGILMEVNNTVEKITEGNVSVRRLMGVELPASRYASRTVLESFLGPTYGSLSEQGLRAIGSVTSGDDFTKSDLRNLRRLIPYQNLSGFRVGVDKIEESIGEQFNLR